MATDPADDDDVITEGVSVSRGTSTEVSSPRGMRVDETGMGADFANLFRIQYALS